MHTYFRLVLFVTLELQTTRVRICACVCVRVCVVTLRNPRYLEWRRKGTVQLNLQTQFQSWEFSLWGESNQRSNNLKS